MAIEKVRRNGPYAPLSATYYQDDDIAEAGEAAELLFLRGLAFCAGRPSDGFISDMQVVRYVGVGMLDAADRAKRLAEVGLWERVEGGYVIRAWLKWNKSAEELGQYRAQDRDRKRGSEGQSVRADSIPGPRADPDRNGQRNPSGNGADSERNDISEPETRTEPDNPGQEFPRGVRTESDTHNTPLHDTSLHSLPPAERTDEYAESLMIVIDENSASQIIPVHTKRRTPRNPDTDPFFIAFWDAYPRKVDKGHARKAWTAKVNAGANPAEIAAGAARYRDDPRRPTEARFIPHPATWINGERWEDQSGVTPPPRRSTSPWEN